MREREPVPGEIVRQPALRDTRWSKKFPETCANEPDVRLHDDETPARPQPASNAAQRIEQLVRAAQVSKTLLAKARSTVPAPRTAASSAMAMLLTSTDGAACSRTAGLSSIAIHLRAVGKRVALSNTIHDEMTVILRSR